MEHEAAHNVLVEQSGGRRFMLHYQPVFELDGRAISHFEALVRLPDDRGRLRAPGPFLRAAERHGLIGRIDRAVLARAVGALAKPDTPSALRVAVNVSARSLGADGPIGHLEQLLERHDVDPSRLVLEITETAAIDDLCAAAEFCRAAERIGCAVALDDFGAGCGSLVHLTRLRFRYLKIDGELVRGVAQSRHDRAVVVALVEMARATDRLAVAEGVGDAATLARLREIGVDLVQGYALGLPQPQEQAFALARPTAAVAA